MRDGRSGRECRHRRRPDRGRDAGPARRRGHAFRRIATARSAARPRSARRPIDVAAWGRELEALFRASDRAQGIGFTLDGRRDADPRRRSGPDEPGADQPDPQRRPGRARPCRGAARLAELRPHPLGTDPDRGRRQRPRRARGAAGRTSSSPSSPPRPKGPASASASPARSSSPTSGSISVGDREGGGALFRIVI